MYSVRPSTRIKIMYVEYPEQMLHFVVAVDADQRRIIATAMTDGELSSIGYKDTGNVLHEVAVARNFTYTITIDHWLEGPVITVVNLESYKLLIEAFKHLGYRVAEERSGPGYKYVVLEK